MALGFDSATGTDSYNGPAGTSTNPADCLYNATALGDLGINEAVFDFYVSSGFQIQGVDPTHSYKLTFFGSHKYNTDNTTVYAVCDSSYNPLVTTSLVVGVDNNHNQDKVATLNNVTAPSGTMYIKFYGQSLPLSGYLNCMSLVDLTTNVAPPGANPTNTCLLDFGMNGTYRGTNTPLTGLTDSLGHYWNNIGTNPLTALPLTNVLGQAAGYSFVFSSTNNTGFGTDSFNGPAGPTDGLPNNQGNNLGLCVFNPTALGWLGMTNAVYDFWVNGLMQIQGMNPAHSYKLTFFGSHKYNIDNTTLYQICSDATYTTVLLQTNLLVGNGASHNQGNVATLTSSPQPNGTMYIKFIGSAGNLGYLNCMQIEDLTGGGPPPTDAYATWRSYYFPGGGQNALGTSDPDGDGVINTNEFLAGFNPNDPNAYPHIIEIRRSAASGNNIKVTFLGANGDVSYSGGPQCRTNVLEYSTGILPSGSYSNNFVSTGQQVILCGGIGGGFVTNLVEVGGATNQPTRYYRIRVLAP
jgi:hypothetical protein